MTTITTRKKLLLLLISQVLVSPVFAAVFDIPCGQTADLINAINSANANDQTDEIHLNVDNQTNCVYPLTAVDNVTDGPNGLPSMTSSITINGNQSTIRRQEDSEAFRIFHVAWQGQLTLKQLDIENGLTGSHWFSKARGGGIYNSGELVLEESSVLRNTATYYGGGIYNKNALATFLDSTISENTASDGGGLSNDSSTITLTNSDVSGNAANGSGGGLNNLQSIATLVNSTVSGNMAMEGGGLSNSEMTLVTLTKSTISENISENRGGGIFNEAGVAFPLFETINSENINIIDPNSFFVVVDFINSTVFGNTSSLGGGIFSGPSCLTTFLNSTVSGNTASRGGGLFNENGDHYLIPASTILKNTILAGNIAMTQSDCANEADDIDFNTNNYNLFSGNGTDCNVGEKDFNLNDLGVTIDEVLETSLTDNGGPTQTLALVPNSPAINAADNAVCPKTDQRGVRRSIRGQCDIGAFEYQPPRFGLSRYSSTIPKIERVRR